MIWGQLSFDKECETNVSKFRGVLLLTEVIFFSRKVFLTEGCKRDGSCSGDVSADQFGSSADILEYSLAKK